VHHLGTARRHSTREGDIGLSCQTPVASSGRAVEVETEVGRRNQSRRAATLLDSPGTGKARHEEWKKGAPPAWKKSAPTHDTHDTIGRPPTARPSAAIEGFLGPPYCAMSLHEELVFKTGWPNGFCTRMDGVSPRMVSRPRNVVPPFR